MSECRHEWEIGLISKGVQLEFVGECAVDGCNEVLSQKEVNCRLNEYAALKRDLKYWKDAHSVLSEVTYNRNAELKRENGGLREGLMQIRTMRLQMPLVNCVPIIDALLTGGEDETE